MAKTKTILVTTAKTKMITGESSGRILKALKKAGAKGLYYDQIVQKADVEPNTLYVLLYRLRKAKLAVTSKDKDGYSFAALRSQDIKIELVPSIN